MRRLARLSLFIVLSSAIIFLLSSCGGAEAYDYYDDVAAEAPEQFNSVFEQKLNFIQQQLSEGRLSYETPSKLAVGEETTISAAILPLVITQQDEDEADEILAEALEVEVDDLQRETIEISDKMQLELIGNEDHFRIRPLQDNVPQPLGEKPTTWGWVVTPLKPGNHTLTLKISAKVNSFSSDVNISNETETRTTTEDRIIEVEIVPSITIPYLLNRYWIPLLVVGVLVVGRTTYTTSKRIAFRRTKRALLADLSTQTPEKGKGYIFVSYAHANEKFVIPLARDLMKNGVRVWLDQREIKAGEEWMNEIEIGLKETDALMIVISPKSMSSDFVMMEIAAAQKTGKKIFPVMYKMTKLPKNLGKLHFIDFQHDYPTALETLLDNLAQAGFKK